MLTTTILFYVLAALTCSCALAVVVSQNIVRAAAWLLFALAGTAGIFFLLGAQFVGATQLLVYVGGTLVLVVFGVMLTAQGPFISMRIGAAEWAIAMCVGLLLYTVLALSILARPDLPAGAEPYDLNQIRSGILGQALLGSEKASPKADLTGVAMAPADQEALDKATDKEEVRRKLRATRKLRPREQISYLFPFEIVSVHLLVVLIGAAYLARAKRRRGTVA
jgi:NADH-quinone oxidoreductase subunit J